MEMTLFQAIGIFVTVIILIVPTYWRYCRGIKESERNLKLNKMNFRDYQEVAASTAIYPESAKLTYPLLGLAGEVGEVCEKAKKHIRDGRELDKEDMKKELGDVLWYLSAVARDLDIDLQDVAVSNIEKLQSRKDRGVLQGSGDNR